MNDFFNSTETQEPVAVESEPLKGGGIASENEQEEDYEEEQGLALGEVEEEGQEDDEDEEESDLQVELKRKDDEIAKIKEDSEKWVRAMQSSFDRKREENERQIIQMQEQLRMLIESQNQAKSQDEYLDEYGEERQLTASEVRKLYQEERNRETSEQEKERREQERLRREQSEAAEYILSQQPDREELESFFETHLKGKDSFVGYLPLEERIKYVRQKMNAKKGKTQTLKTKKKRRVPPVGNPNKNFQSSGDVFSANSLMKALESKRRSLGVM